MSCNILRKKNFLRLSQEDEISKKAFIMWNYTRVSTALSPSFLPWKKCSCGFNRTEIKSHVPGCCFMLGHSPNQHQTSLDCNSSCSPLVHFMRDSHGPELYGYGRNRDRREAKGTREPREPQAKIQERLNFVWGIMYFQMFADLHQIHLFQAMISVLSSFDWPAPSLGHPNFSVHTYVHPPICLVPCPIICRAWTGGSLGVGNLSFLVKLPKWPCFYCLDFLLLLFY